VNRKELDLAAVLEAFKRHDPILAGRLAGAEAIGPIRAHPLRTHVGGTRSHAFRILVLGDAAGLVSPFTGEGITSGMISGALAARFATDAFASGDFSAAALAPYTQALKQRFASDHNAAYVLRSILRDPRLLDHFFRVMAADADLARTFALAYLDEVSPQLLLHPRNLVKLLRKR
jgi:flavin-dependent dehydrogenase